MGLPTSGMLTPSLALRMKSTAFFVNTSRGAVVDETALLDALRKGDIAGAALDVLVGEPGIGKRHPLVSYARANSNLVITPHIGGATCEAMPRCEEYLAEEVVAAVAQGNQQ